MIRVDNPFSKRAQETLTAFASEQVVPKFGYEPDRQTRLRAISEYISAGRNLANLCDRLSRREKKPILVLNNPRTGAFLQLGFRHWLGNFKTEQEAEEFVSELEADSEYTELQAILEKQIKELSAGLESLRVKNKFTFDEIGELPPDPSADIRLELFTHRKPSDSQIAIFKTKDKMRASILKHAKSWIDSGKIDSFVYPLNHWKKSGGALPSEHDQEIFLYGEAKLAESVSTPDTLIVAADVHGTYPEDKKDRGGQLPFVSGLEQYWDTEFRDQFIDIYGQDSYEVRYLRDPDSIERKFVDVARYAPAIRRSLEYPGSKNAAGKLHSVQKSILEQVSREHPKIISLQVLFPSQEVGEVGKECDHMTKTKLNIMDTAGESQADPFRVMKDHDLMIGLRKATEKIRGNPKWLNKFKGRIMLESNYTFAGPELGKEPVASQEKLEKLREAIATIASGCRELSDWNPEFDHPALMQLINRIKAKSAAFLMKFHTLGQTDNEEEMGKLIAGAPVLDVEEFRTTVFHEFSTKEVDILKQIESKLGLSFKGGSPPVGSIAKKLDSAV